MPEERLDTGPIVNLSRYPIADLSSPPARALAINYRREFANSGLCMLPEFILPSGLDSLTKEANGVIDEAYFCNNTHNAYLTETDPDLPQDDISHHQEQTFVGSVPYDRINQAGLLNRLYLMGPFEGFSELCSE